MVFKELAGGGGFLDHLIYPLIFLGKQIGILIPFLLIVFFSYKKNEI